ncbi:MD-2-related lipid-recognition domain-containing protein [Mycena epipterygia]|nr:MD-2-related lipid-recognition domain-containing protein [Mycena epipterygia]
MLRLITFITLFTFLLTYASAAGWQYVDCGTPSQPLQIGSINVSPDPPMPGQDLTVTVNAVVTETIEEGASADVVVKLGLIKLLQKKFDVCEEARNKNATVSCPVEPGPYTVVQTVALPKEIPQGEYCMAKFVVLIRGFTEADDNMLCLGMFPLLSQ